MRKKKKHNSQPIQLTINFFVSGNESIKPLEKDELLRRILRVADPAGRAEESLLNLPEHLFLSVLKGLIREYHSRK